MKPLFISLALAAILLAGQATAADKAQPPEGVRVLRDLEYARPNDKPLLLDLYLPAAPKAHGPKPPVVIWVHGGGWKNGSKERCPASWLAEHGYAVASINYRLIPDHQWPAQMDDCRAAVRWLRQHAASHGADATRIAAWGGSAGGHLVALMGTLDAPEGEQVQAVIDWYGPSDLLTMPPNVLSNKRDREELAKSNGALLVGGIVMDLPEKAKAASALYQTNAGDAPFLIMHGSADPGVPVDQSSRLHEKLQAAGVESTLYLVPGAGHGGKEFNSPEVREMILKFLHKHLPIKAS